jgi:hypothetical protein
LPQVAALPLQHLLLLLRELQGGKGAFVLFALFQFQKCFAKHRCRASRPRC